MYCILDSKNIIINIIVCHSDNDAVLLNAKPFYDGAIIGSVYNPPEPYPIPTTTSTEIASGTYTGTGLYGETNPNSVRPNIQAKVLMIFQNDQILLTLSRAEATDEPFTWSASSAKEQCNENGFIYNWIAIS